MRNSGIQLRISDLLFALQKHWKLILSLTFLGLVFGLLLSGITYVQDSLQMYEISGSVAVTTKALNGNYLGNNTVPTANDYHLAEDMTDAVMFIMKSKDAVNNVINEMGILGVTVSDIKSNLTVTQYNETQILTMRLVWSNAEVGIDIWNTVIQVANEMIPRILQIGTLEVINEPQADPYGTASSDGSVWMALAILGFAAGIGYAVMELLMHPTLTNIKDVETTFGLETLGVIPKDNTYFRKKNSILVKDDITASEVGQNFATMAYILRNRLNTREKHHCFYVTSSTNREGRTTVAANLAIQLSDMEHKTLLIDFDTHNPSLGSLFLNTVDYANSLNALYRGEINEKEAITTLTGHLDLLPMVLEHNSISMDNTIMELINNLAQQYEYVIIDAPPVGKESETLSLNQVANTVLFVVGYDKATIPEIQSSLEKLDKSGIRVLGCVINEAQAANNFSNFLGDKDGGRRSGKKKKLRQPEKDEHSADGKAEDADTLPPTFKPSAKKDKDDKKASKEKQQKKKKTTKPSAQQAQQTMIPTFSPSRNVLEELMNENVVSSKSEQENTSVLTRMEEEDTAASRRETDEKQDRLLHQPSDEQKTDSSSDSSKE